MPGFVRLSELSHCNHWWGPSRNGGRGGWVVPCRGGGGGGGGGGPFQTPPPPPPPPHPLLPNLTYNGFWPWNLAFSGSLFLVISRKCHRNFKVVTFPKVANSLPVCQWTTKLNPGFCPSSEKFNIIILKLRQTRKTEKCRQIKKGGGVFVWAIKST